MTRPDSGQEIFDLSVQLRAVVDEGMRIVDWVQREPLVGVPSVFGPLALISWAFGRSRKERSMQDWDTR